MPTEFLVLFKRFLPNSSRNCVNLNSKKQYMKNPFPTNPFPIHIRVFHFFLCSYVCAKLCHLCPTLCDPNGLVGSSAPGILQAKKLEWVATSSRGSSPPRDRIHISCIGRRVLCRQCHLGSPSLLTGALFSPEPSTSCYRARAAGPGNQECKKIQRTRIQENQKSSSPGAF